ncbi:hypothetical protein [Bacillus subtilis]|nr:hypothetical protein [Bacillus subtilis]KIN45139.1 hypothetical protein B4071_4280 [Bacillus subtilis]
MKKEQKNSPFVISKRDLYNPKIKKLLNFFSQNPNTLKNHLQPFTAF